MKKNNHLCTAKKRILNGYSIGENIHHIDFSEEFNSSRSGIASSIFRAADIIFVNSCTTWLGIQLSLVLIICLKRDMNVLIRCNNLKVCYNG
jgi:hypothetical protein